MNYLKIIIPQENQVQQIDYDPNITPSQICQKIYQNLFPQNTISTLKTKLMLRNLELDMNKSIQKQGIIRQEELQFYYYQLLQINCLCDNQSFTLQVDYLEKIENYVNHFKSKFKKQYQGYQINILCKSGPYNKDYMWFQTGITNNSQVDIQILLPISFTFKHNRFQEFIPSTWQVHKIIAYLRGKKTINEIIQFNSLNKIIDYDLELYQLYPNIYDWQIEIVDEPQYLIKLSDNRSKMIKINSQNKVSDLCELIKNEFNINQDVILDLQYGQMTLIHEALIVEEMILNNSTIVITNQNLNSKDNSNQKTKDIYDNRLNNIRIVIVNKINPTQIFNTILRSTSQVNNLDTLFITSDKKDKFSIQYFYKDKQINENTILQNLVSEKETEIKLEFTISRKISVMKNIVSYDQTYKFRFKFLNQEYAKNVSITNTLKQIEEDLKKQNSIPEEYSIFLNDSCIESQSIMDLELQSLNILFEFKKVDFIPFLVYINPIQKTLNLKTSTESTVMWLREKIRRTFLKENDQARIQINLDKAILQDDHQLYLKLKQSEKRIIEAFIFDKFQIQFQDPNQQILNDYVYEDYCIQDSVICLGLEECDFYIDNTTINPDKSFQYYKINKNNQIIKYKKQLNSSISLKQEPSIQQYQNFTTQQHSKLNNYQAKDQKQQF